MTLRDEVVHWMVERENLRLGKGSRDEILRRYRFCNVRREDDKVTRWLRKYWRDPHMGHENMVPAMLLARMVNWPPTLAEIGFPTKWDPDRIIRTIQRRAARGEKTWSGAYIVSTCGARMDKAVYVVGTVCAAAVGPHYTPRPGDTLESVWTRLRGIPGLGAGFIAAQVVADLKHCDTHLLMADDWMTWAVPGPGSRRGINRYFGYELNQTLPVGDWQERLLEVMHEVEEHLPEHLWRVSAQDYQNVMCEFDKYMRTKLGEGKPRSIYRSDNSYVV